MTTKAEKYLKEIVFHFKVLVSAEEPKQEDLDSDFVFIWYNLHLSRLVNAVCGFNFEYKYKYISKESIRQLILLHDRGYIELSNNQQIYIPKYCTRAEAVPRITLINKYIFIKIKPIISIILERAQQPV